MFKFIKKEVVPIPGFTFTDPDTYKTFKAKNYNNFDELEHHVQNYRAQNSLPPIENFREVWEHFICSNFPQMRGSCCPVEGDIARNFKQYVSGAKAYIKSLFQKEGEKFVTEEVANERAQVCLRCNLNQLNHGHYYAQYYTDKLMARSVGKRVVRNWESLYTCAGCSCILNSKVWFADKIVGQSLMREDIARLASARTVEGKAFRCWQLVARDKLNEESN